MDRKVYGLTVSRSTIEDASQIKIRKEDLAEISLYGIGSPAAGLRNSISHSLATFGVWTAMDTNTGEVVAIYGAATDYRLRVTCPWMVSSESIKNHGRAAVHLGKEVYRMLAVAGSLKVQNYISKQARANRAFTARVGYKFKILDDGPFDIFYIQ